MTLLAGAVMFLIGALRWGQLLRFVPYPVVGGFLAATGWLLIIMPMRIRRKLIAAPRQSQGGTTRREGLRGCGLSAIMFWYGCRFSS